MTHKILIAIVTCNGREDWVEVIRNTWMPLVKGADVRFFKGTEDLHTTEDNFSVQLNCRDDYQGLPNKVQEIVKWALNHEYDYMLKCDDDVVINPCKILRSGFEQYDFVGHECAPNNQTPWGFNYWLSKKAMKIVADDILPSDNNDEAWVSRAMNRNGILLKHDDRYMLHYGRNLGIMPERRSLRKPVEMPKYESEIFSWCMHNHNVDRKILIQEFIRVYEREVKTQCQR